MMHQFISSILNNRRASTLILSLLLAFGLILLSRIPISFYPKTSKPSFRVTVAGTGMAAEDLYNDYNARIQSAIADIASLESSTVSYSSVSGNISITLEFPWRMSVDEAELESQTFANRLKSSLPSSFNDPSLGYFSDNSSGELDIAFYSSILTNEEIYNEALALFEDELSNIREIDSFDISPINQLKAEVIFRPDALLNLGLTIDNVISRISNEYRSTSLGSFRDGRQSFTVRSISTTDNVFQLGEIPVATLGKQIILLNNIADVNVYYDLPRNVYRVNGEPAIMMNIYPKQGESVKVMSENVLKVVNSKMHLFSEEVEMNILLNPAEFIDVAISNVLTSAIVGAVLAVIVTLLFLGIVRNTLIVVSAIPISIIYAFIFLYNFDVSINLISLSGLALAVGMSLDGAIVVMENIHRHRLDNIKNGSPLPMRQVIMQATQEVAQPVIMSALTTMAVFLPLKFTSPLASAVLGDLALAVVFTLLASIFVSFTVIPISAYYFFRPRKKHPLPQQTLEPSRLLLLSNKIMQFLLNIYEKGLNFFIASKLRGVLLLLISISLFIFSLFLLNLIPFKIIEDPSSSSITVSITNNELSDLNDFILELAPIENQIVRLLDDKLSARFFRTRGNNQGTLFIFLTSTKAAEEAFNLLESSLISDNTWSFSVQRYNPAPMPIPTTWSFQIAVSGTDKQQIFNYMERILDLAMQVKDSEGNRAYRGVMTIPGTQPTNELIFTSKDEVFIDLPEFSKTRLNALISTYLNGSRPLTFLLEDGSEIKPSFAFPALSTKEDINNILIPYNDKALPISHFFHIEDRKGLSSIFLTDQRIINEVRGIAPSNVLPANLVKYEKELDSLIQENITFDPGYSYRMLDARAVINEAITSLKYAFLISVVLVFLVLTVQFNSFKLSFIVILAIPLGIIGAVLSLYFTKLSISINSMLGMILLGGIAINNSLLIVDFYVNDHISQEKNQAIIRACMLRLPAILSTTVTTLLGMLPLAFAIGDGSNVIQSLGVAVSGGLALSTFFTLFVIPVVLSLFTSKRQTSTTQDNL